MKEKENTNHKNKKLSWGKIECRLKTENWKCQWDFWHLEIEKFVLVKTKAETQGNLSIIKETDSDKKIKSKDNLLRLPGWNWRTLMETF